MSVVVVAAAGGVAAEAAAEVVVSSVLRSACAEWEQDDIVFACDPRGEGRRITLRLGGDRVSRFSRRRPPGGEPVDGAWLDIGGDEPLHAGETVVLDWPRPSTEAELAVKAFTPHGLRTVVLRLTWRPRHVSVTVRPDGGLEVRSPGRTDVVAPPTPAPSERDLWHPHNAGDAARRVLWVVDHLADRGVRGAVMRTLCAGLHPDVYAFYGSAIQLRGTDDPARRRTSCAEEMWSRVRALHVELRASRHHGHSLRVRGRRAVLRTTIVQRYDPRVGDVPPRLVIPARVLLLKDGAGVWRLASFDAITPEAANSAEIYPSAGGGRYDDRSLEASYRHAVRWAARHQAEYDHWQAELHASRTVAGTVPPCVPAWKPDARRDVEISGERQRLTRLPLAHLDGDLTAAGFDGHCLGVRTSGPLPSRFRVFLNLGDDDRGDALEYHVDVDQEQRSVVATHGTFDDGAVPGMQASIAEHELVVRFAGTLPAQPVPAYVGIDTSPIGVGYIDGITYFDGISLD